MTQILALQTLELDPEITIICFSVSYSGWSGATG